MLVIVDFCCPLVSILLRPLSFPSFPSFILLPFLLSHLPMLFLQSPSSLLPPPSSLLPPSRSSLVPSAPLNVTYENLTATSIRVSWSTPAEPNGIIDNYTIEYTDLSTNEMLSIDSITSTFVNITGLMEYQQYTIVVYAYTDKGRGNGSDPLVVLTAEHCKEHGFSILLAY